MSYDPEAFVEAVAKYLTHVNLDSGPQQGHASHPEPQQGHASHPEPQQGHASHPEHQQGHASHPEPPTEHVPFTGINLDVKPDDEVQEEAEFVPATEEERVSYDLYKNHNASYAMVLNMNFIKDDKTGSMHIKPKDPKGYFPYLIDFVNGYDDWARIPDIAPEFKVTSNVIKKVHAGEPLDGIPEPFDEETEFDIRNYLMAYTYTIVYLYGDGKLTPTSQEMMDYTVCLVNYIAKTSKNTRAEILASDKPGNRFHDRYPDNFITKYVMSQPEPEKHALYWQFMNCSIPDPGNHYVSCSYLYHAYAITPSRMHLLTKLNEMDVIKLDPFIIKCYEKVSKFIKYEKDGPHRFPVFRINGH
jgi:hypothetical protein